MAKLLKGFERFDDKARRVMALARDEASKFGHHWLGSEHVLLGLVGEGSGMAHSVLSSLGFDLGNLRVEVRKFVDLGPDIRQPGYGVAQSDPLPPTPHAQRVVEYALKEARDFGHDRIGTEHLLLGVLDDEDGVGARVLKNMGLKSKDIRNEVINLMLSVPRPHKNKRVSCGSSKLPAMAKLRKLIKDIRVKKQAALDNGNKKLADDLETIAEDLEAEAKRNQKFFQEFCDKVDKMFGV